MSARGMYAVSGAIAAFITNIMMHVYIEMKALRMIPPDLLVAVAIVPLFPVWIVVIFGISRLRKWGFQIGLVSSLLAAAIGIVGFLLGWIETIMTLTLEFVQIVFCAYVLRRIEF